MAVPALLLCLIAGADVSAQRYQSSSYTIDTSTMNDFGGASSSGSYRLEGSGGEAVIGLGTSGSYKMGQGYIQSLDQSLELQIHPSTLAGHYGFNENIGIRSFDGTANTANADLFNTPSWTTGKISNALQFNGSSQYASISSTAQNNLETVSVSAWIRTSQTPGSITPIVQKYDGSGGFPYGLQLDTSGRARFTASDGTNTPAVHSGDAVNDGNWHHIVGVRDKGQTLKIYLDGVLKNTTTDTATGTSTNSSGLYVARVGGGAQYFSGTIDEIKIFNEVLSDAKVSHEYSAQSAGYVTASTFGDLGLNSQTVDTLAIVQTDAPGYTLAISQDQNLTNGANSIPPVSGTIASPADWTEGTTNGLGFTITAGVSVPAKWGTNPNYKYAAIPGTSTSFYSRSGYLGAVKDQLSLRYRVDVASNQVAGSYSNQVTYTATIQP